MDFSWPPAARALLEEYSTFGEGFFSHRKPPAGLDMEAWSACAGRGILHLLPRSTERPETSGLLVAAGVMDALGRAGADRGLLFALGAHLFGCQLPILLYGSESQRQELSPPLSSGGMIGALAVTEPQGGSSPSAMHTTARHQPDGDYLLSGHKTLVTNAPDAHLFLVVAATRPDRGSFGWSAFLVPRDAPGLSITSLPTAGLPGAPLGEVRFDDCRLGPDSLLGSPEGGLRIFASAMQFERAGILSGFLGAADKDLSDCVEFVNHRRDAEGPLSAHQSVAHPIARTRIRIERARLLLYQAAWAIDAGEKKAQRLAAMAKHEAAETVVESALDLFRITAGSGWRGESSTPAALRDALGTLFASGTQEVQLNIIAASLGLRRR